MKVFLAGQNGLHNIVKGSAYIYIYMAGGISGNLKPALAKFAKQEINDENFIRSLYDENFWRGGESRHWLQDLTSPTKENDDLSERNDVGQYGKSDRSIRGGLP